MGIAEALAKLELITHSRIGPISDQVNFRSTKLIEGTDTGIRRYWQEVIGRAA